MRKIALPLLLIFLVSISVATAFQVGDFHVYDPGNTNFLIPNWQNNTMPGTPVVYVNATTYNISKGSVLDKTPGITTSVPLNISYQNKTVFGANIREVGNQIVRLWIGNVSAAYAGETLTNATYPGFGIFMRITNDNDYRITSSENGTEINEVGGISPGSPDNTALQNVSLVLDFGGKTIYLTHNNVELSSCADAACQAWIKKFYDERDSLVGGLYAVRTAGGAGSDMIVNNIYTSTYEIPPNQPVNIVAGSRQPGNALGEINQTNGTLQTYRINATVADDDTLIFNYTIDTVLVQTQNISGTTSLGVQVNYTHNATTTGNFTLEALVAELSGGLSDDTSWALQILAAANNPPTIDATDPSQGALNITNGTTQLFRVNATDLDNDVLSYEWFNNGAAIAGATTANYTYNASTVTNITLTTHVNDSEGDSATTNATWTVQTLLGSLPPTINAYSPTTPHSTLVFTTTLYQLNATDPNLDPLSYNWSINGTDQNTNSKNFSHTPTLKNVFSIIGTVNDSTGSDSQTWLTTVGNTAPNITNTTPATPLNITGSQAFTITATDPEGQSLSYAWYIDAALQAAATSTFTYNPTAADNGNHTITGITSDTETTSNHTWTVSVQVSTTGYQNSYESGDVGNVAIDIIVGIGATLVSLIALIGIAWGVRTIIRKNKK